MDVEEDGGEGEMVRGQESSRAAPSKAGGACGTSLQVPVPVLCLGGSNGSRQVRSHLLQVPRNSSPKIGFDRACQGPGGERLARDWADKQEIERAKPKPREVVSVCAGASLPHPPTQTHFLEVQSLPQSVKRAPD